MRLVLARLTVMIPWQEIATGLVVGAAVIYVLWRLRGGGNGGGSSGKGPDVPLSRLRQKNKPRRSCGH